MALAGIPLGRIPHGLPLSGRAQEKSWALFNSGVAATLWTGKREVKILHLGCGHTKGDTVVWLSQEKILFSGDLLEYAATPYAGEACLNDWPHTLTKIAALKPESQQRQAAIRLSLSPQPSVPALQTPRTAPPPRWP